MTRYENQLDSLGYDRDLRDAELIYEMYKAIVAINKMDHQRRGFINRTSRELIQKIWQEPRFPKNRLGHNKPYDYPWSKQARAVLESGDFKNKLHLEHVLPIRKYCEALEEALLNSKISSAEDMLEYLQESHQGFMFFVITEEEHKTLSKVEKVIEIKPWEFYEKLNLYRHESISVSESRQ